ncbi:MAG: DUF5397 family protein [Alphaproteobacteria bacterium]|nr:DUF5397 family protein [Alphaproteobacteria bacterium]
MALANRGPSIESRQGVWRGAPEGVVGTWRRFGPVGPVYEIIGKECDLPGGDSLMRVRVVESGEEIDYKLTDILDDPMER